MGPIRLILLVAALLAPSIEAGASRRCASSSSTPTATRSLRRTSARCRRRQTLGLQQVTLKDDTRKHPGMFKLTAKAKRWFTGAQANQAAADSSVRVTIGGQCVSHLVTKKKD